MLVEKMTCDKCYNAIAFKGNSQIDAAIRGEIIHVKVHDTGKASVTMKCDVCHREFTFFIG